MVQEKERTVKMMRKTTPATAWGKSLDPSVTFDNTASFLRSRYTFDPK